MKLVSVATGLTKKLVAISLVTAAVSVGLNMAASPASAHADYRDPSLGQHSAWAQCLTLQSGRYMRSFGRMTRTPGFVGTHTVGGVGILGNVAPRFDETYEAQWLFYRVLIQWTDVYGRTHTRAGNWIATRYGELGGHTPMSYIWVQQSDGSWLQAANVWGTILGGGREDVSVVSGLPGPGTYSVWGDFYWGPIYNSRGQTVYGGNRHYESMGRVTCQ